MSGNQYDTTESGTLPGRYEWLPEPSGPMSVPTDPEWNRFSDTMRSFNADVGVSYARQDDIGNPDAADHNRGTEDPSASIAYDLQRFPIDTNDKPIGAEAYGILRDEFNQLIGSLIAVERTEAPGGNDGAGMRIYTVVRGAKVESVDPTNDPSEENPILMELSLQPTKVRSYAIHQLSATSTLEISSTDANDTMEITIESEGATTTETITLDGTTAVTTTESFSDVDAIWLSDEPAGDVTVTDGSGTTVCELIGGLTYSDDDQPVAGDRGIPALGSGSHADPIGTGYEHFVGDRVERPVGSPVRPRVQSAGWTVENDFTTDSVHTSQLPTVDESDRTVTIDADVAGPKVSHDSMMEALAKDQQDYEHEVSGGIFRFKNTVVESPGERTREADGQAVAAINETFAASGEPAIELEATN